MVRNIFRSRLNQVTYVCVALMALIFLVLAVVVGPAASFGAHGTLAYYMAVTGTSLKYIVLCAAYVAAVFLAFLVIASLIRNFVNLARGSKEPPMMIGSDTIRGAFGNAGRRIGNALTGMAPAVFFIVFMSFALDGLNAIARTKLIDFSLVNAERAIFGNYGFMIFAGASYPEWLIRFIIISFVNMSGILLTAGFVVAYFRLDILRKFSAAFCLGMLMMVPLWFFFPALSPQDRFLSNAYHLAIPAPIAQAVANFHTEPIIANFLATVDAGKQGLADLPTSTFPSAHAAWAVLAGYYLFKTKKWFGWIALPFLIASTAGTVILAQHYFFDPIFGILIAALAIWIVERIEREDVVKM